MKSLFKTLTVVSLLGLSSFSFADTNKPLACYFQTLQAQTHAQRLAKEQWYKENCLPPSNESTSKTSNKRNVSDERDKLIFSN